MNSMQIERIVAHAGAAHKDDFLACAVAMAAAGKVLPVERRDPTPAELEDPMVLVLDVGMKHAPAKSNFDHHQLPKGVEHCALSLLLCELELDRIFMKVYPWYLPTIWLDCTGPLATAHRLEISKDAFMACLDPIGWGLIKLWEKNPNQYGELLLALGKELVGLARKVQDELMAIPFHSTTANSAGVRILTVEEKYEPKTMEIHQQTLVEDGKGKVGIVISPDDRGPGWALYRVDDHPQVNFSKLEGMAGVVFAAKGGFIAKTDAMSVTEAQILAFKAITELLPPLPQPGE